jgi:hypothetical protein
MGDRRYERALEQFAEMVATPSGFTAPIKLSPSSQAPVGDRRLGPRRPNDAKVVSIASASSVSATVAETPEQANAPALPRGNAGVAGQYDASRPRSTTSSPTASTRPNSRASPTKRRR